ncbi:MAG TPA: hypothetical protein VM553_01950 [Dongiaceae bacterium]|nr:hypothetical protein [Dongiaceae bacterium]
MNDFYASPSATVADERRGNKWVALAVGIAIDLGLSTGAGMVLSFVVMGMLMRENVPLTAMENRINEVMPAVMDSPLGYGFTVVGMLASMLGAYVCARIANHQEYRLAGVLALVAITLYILMGSTHTSLWVEAGMLAINIGAIFLGAWLHVRKKAV